MGRAANACVCVRPSVFSLHLDEYVNCLSPWINEKQKKKIRRSTHFNYVMTDMEITNVSSNLCSFFSAALINTSLFTNLSEFVFSLILSC